jgi:hypothetical protein
MTQQIQIDWRFPTVTNGATFDILAEEPDDFYMHLGDFFHDAAFDDYVEEALTALTEPREESIYVLTAVREATSDLLDDDWSDETYVVAGNFSERYGNRVTLLASIDGDPESTQLACDAVARSLWALRDFEEAPSVTMALSARAEIQQLARIDSFSSVVSLLKETLESLERRWETSPQPIVLRASISRVEDTEPSYDPSMQVVQHLHHDQSEETE